MAQHTEIRDKLNEHIIYLQNEVRKRDELLEEDSAFGDDNDFAPESDSGSLQEDVSSSKNINDSDVQPRRIPGSKRRTMGEILKK